MNDINNPHLSRRWDDELYHSGRKGQKWGVRLFQNIDRTWTELGKIRYGRGGNTRNYSHDSLDDQNKRSAKADYDGDTSIGTIRPSSIKTRLTKTVYSVPNKSVNGIEFGTSRDEVIKKLGKPKNSFYKTRDSESRTDEYPNCHVYYSKNGDMEAIEYFGNNNALYYKQKQIYPGNINDIKKIIPGIKNELGNYVSKTESIGIGTDEKGNIDSILFGKKDYYNGNKTSNTSDNKNNINVKDTKKVEKQFEKNVRFSGTKSLIGGDHSKDETNRVRNEYLNAVVKNRKQLRRGGMAEFSKPYYRRYAIASLKEMGYEPNDHNVEWLMNQYWFRIPGGSDMLYD